MDNRKTRRAKKSMFKKELRTAIFDDFTIVDTMGHKMPSMGTFQGMWRNAIYSVQIYEKDNFKLLGIRRHDEKPSCPWSHKQKISRLFLDKDSYAIEIFPPESKLIDAANMYWLWSGTDIDNIASKLSIK